jgi:hypothetical protein
MNGLHAIATVIWVLMGTGCDCVRTVHASVVDDRSGLPLEGVSVREHQASGDYEEQACTSDGSGAFSFSDISGGLRHCPDVRLHFSRSGYVPVDRSFPSYSEGDTVRLHRE